MDIFCSKSKKPDQLHHKQRVWNYLDINPSTLKIEDYEHLLSIHAQAYIEATASWRYQLKRLIKAFTLCGDDDYLILKAHPAYLQAIYSPKLDLNWDQRTADKPSFLMICHDQTIDRRILQEARSLQDNGWVGIVVALNFDLYADAFEIINQVTIHRIAVKRIVGNSPDNKAFYYRDLVLSQKPLGCVTRRLNRLLAYLQRGLIYGFRKGSCTDNPLRYDLAFYGAAKHYKANVIIGHDLTSLKAATILGEKWNVPVVYDAHELYPEQSAFTSKQKKMLTLFENELIKKCKEVFTVNQSIAEVMAARYNCRQPHVLLNAVDRPPKSSTGTHQSLRNHFGLAPEVPIILMHGGLGGDRNFMSLIEAMAHLKHPESILIFMGDGSTVPALKQTAANKNLTDRILFKEAVPQDDLVAWVASADIGLIPYTAVDLNSKYCTPNKLFEYIQAGVPIVANDLPELRRYVHETGFGRVIDMADPTAIAQTIDDMLSDPVALEDIRLKILDERDQYCWQRQAELFVNTINQLLEI